MCTSEKILYSHKSRNSLEVNYQVFPYLLSTTYYLLLILHELYAKSGFTRAIGS